VSPEISGAIVGASGVLLGALLQITVAAVANGRQNRRQLITGWGTILTEMLDLGSAIERKLQTGHFTTQERTTLQQDLDHAGNKVHLLCPLELTRPAFQYIRAAHLLLGGSGSSERLDLASQDVALVYRRVSGINSAIAWMNRGRRARKDIVPEYR
jgi:hypothetical protein